MKIKVINKSKHPLPEYSTEASAGMDLRANLEKEMVLEANGKMSGSNRFISGNSCRI